MLGPRIPPSDPRHRPDLDGQVRADAYELFMAEAARMRLVERSGPARVILRSGVALSGQLVPPDGPNAVHGLIDLLARDGRRLRVPAEAVVALVGASAALRDEGSSGPPRSIASLLREIWATRGRARTLLRDAGWIEGAIVLVGADHVELESAGERWVVPFAAVDVWDLFESD